MNRLVSLIGALIAVVSFSDAIAEQRVRITCDPALSSLATIITKHSKLASNDIDKVGDVHSFCQYRGSNDILFTTRKMSDDDLSECRDYGVNNLVEYEFGTTGPVYVYAKITSGNQPSETSQFLSTMWDFVLSKNPDLIKLGVMTDSRSTPKCPKPRCPLTSSCSSTIRELLKCCPKTGSCQ